MSDLEGNLEEAFSRDKSHNGSNMKYLENTDLLNMLKQ